MECLLRQVRTSTNWNHLSTCGGNFFLTDLSRFDTRRVENLALYDCINLDWCGGFDTLYDNYENWLCDVLQAFCNLKKLTIVVYQSHGRGYEKRSLSLQGPRSNRRSWPDEVPNSGTGWRRMYLFSHNRILP